MIVDLDTDLWIWRIPHPNWEPDGIGDRWVTSVCVAEGDVVAVLDAVAPEEGDEIWTRLDVRPPTIGVVLKPDHVRDIDVFVRRYGLKPYGPDVFQKDDVPESDLELIYPGSSLPGGFLALYDGRLRNETPLWLPAHRTIVFADAFTTFGGELQVWWTPWHTERVLPALRAMLELPFEQIIISHGEPVHGRDEFEVALTRDPIRVD